MTPKSRVSSKRFPVPSNLNVVHFWDTRCIRPSGIMWYNYLGHPVYSAFRYTYVCSSLPFEMRSEVAVSVSTLSATAATEEVEGTDWTGGAVGEVAGGGVEVEGGVSPHPETVAGASGLGGAGALGPGLGSVGFLEQ